MPRKSKFLDIDRSIIERNILIAKEHQLDADIKKYFAPDIPTAKLMKPNPGFCVKTRVKNEDRKIFVNICQTDLIPAPEEKTDEELLTILNSDEPSTYRVPMSASEPHTERDKGGRPVTVYDVAINTQFLEKIERSAIFHRFFLTVVFEVLEDKYDFDLEIEDFVQLKNRKSIGTIQMQRIQTRDLESCGRKSGSPLIQELPGGPKKPTLAALKRDTLTQMDYQLIREPREGKIEYLVGEFRIERTLTSDDITLNIGEDRLVVETRKANQMIDIFIPYHIKQDTAKAVLNRNTSILTVTMAAFDPPGNCL